MTRADRDQLLARYLEGKLAAEDEAALLELLRQDPRAADELEAFLRLDEGLREAMVAEASGDALSRAVAERLREDGRTDHFARAVLERLQSEEKPEKPGTRRIRRVHRRRGAPSGPGAWGAALMAAAALFLLVILATVSGPGRGGRTNPPRPVVQAPSEPERDPLPPTTPERREKEERQVPILESLAKLEREEEELRLRMAEKDAQEKQEELLRKVRELEEARNRYLQTLLPEPEPAKREDPPAPKPSPTPKTQIAVATVERVDGAVFLLSEGARSPIRAGLDLLPGQGLEAAGTAVVVYADRTRLELSAGTEARDFVAANGKRLFVARGVVQAEVSKQPAGQPMVFATPHGEATVLGTTLRLAVEAASTRLEVKEGKVRLTPKDGKGAEVVSGHFAVASVGLDATAKPLPIDEILVLASQGRLSGAEWRRVPDGRAFGGIAVEAPQVWNGALNADAYARLKKRTLGYVELTFRADADKDYAVWVHGARVLKGAPEGSGKEWYRFDFVALEPLAATSTTHLPFDKDVDAYQFNGFGQREGYWWLSGNADPGVPGMPENRPSDPAPVTVRFQKPGLQRLKIYPIETPLRIDAVWLSATQKKRPADGQRPPEPSRK
jgi:ferric-dicitrate binding protein FerR (iron transport regulator)